MSNMVSMKTLGEQLFEAISLETNLCLYHPFFKRIYQQKLSAETFQVYLRQDKYLLAAKLKACTWLIDRISHSDGKLVLRALWNDLEKYQSCLQKWHVEEGAIPTKATMYYLELLERIYQQNSVAILLVVMVLPIRLFAFIGTSLKEFYFANHDTLVSHRYSEWISEFSNIQLRETIENVEMLMTRTAAEEMLGFEDLIPIYHEVIYYEFQMLSEYFPLTNYSENSYASMLENKTIVTHFKNADANLSGNLKEIENAVACIHNRNESVFCVSLSDDIDFLEKNESIGNLRILLNLSGVNCSARKYCHLFLYHEVESPADHIFLAESWNEIYVFLLGAPYILENNKVLFGKHDSSKLLPKRVLCISGSDSGGGAGIQADIKTCTNLRVYSASVITAITAQNTQGVQEVHAIPAQIVQSQLRSVVNDIGVDVIKTGMLSSGDIIETIAAFLNTKVTKPYKLVIDPVMVASSGDALIDKDEQDHPINKMIKLLFPLATLITPNIPEASKLLSGLEIIDVDDMKNAAKLLHDYGPRFVLVKGGHLTNQNQLTDILYDGNVFHEITNNRVLTENTHGTGCTLASAIAAEIAKTNNVILAIKTARQYLQNLLQKSKYCSLGQGKNKPMLHY